MKMLINNRISNFLMKLILSTFGWVTFCNAQSNINFGEIKIKSKQYYDSIQTITPDSIFYSEGSNFSNYKKWETFWEGRLSDDATFENYYEKLQSYNLSNLNRGPITSTSSFWSELGPKNTPSSGIGPVEFVKFCKNAVNHNTDTMICGSTAGGLFYSNDHGNTWENAGTDLIKNSNGERAYSSVSCAEFRVGDAQVIYAGIGESFDCEPGYIHDLGGIYRIIQNGNINRNSQWEQIADRNHFGGHWDCRIQKILTDVDHPNTLYVATTWGLFKSTNINAINPTQVSWTLILNDNVYDIEMNPTNSTILYASFCKYNKGWQFPNPNPSQNTNIVKISTDAGASWLPITFSGVNDPTLIASASLEVSNAFSDNLYITFKQIGATEDLYKYSYSSQSSNFVYSNTSSYALFGAGNTFGIPQSGTYESIFLSNDVNLIKVTISGSTIIANTVSVGHDDKECVTFNPYDENEIWVCTHGGINESVNGGVSWINQSKGIGVAQTMDIATAYKDPDEISLALFHDNGVITNGVETDGSPYQWRSFADGDGLRTLIDKQNPENVYYTHQKYYWQPYNIWRHSSNFGYGLYGTQLRCDDWHPRGKLNREISGIIYESQNTEVVRSFDYGSTYTTISNLNSITNSIPPNPTCPGCYVDKIFTADENKNYLFASYKNDGSTSIAKLFYTDKAACQLYPNPNCIIDPINDWHEININEPLRRVLFVKFDPEHQNTIYIALSNNWSNNLVSGLLKVENFSSSTPIITDMTSNLPNVNCTALELEKGSDGGLYFASDGVGVLYTNNKLFNQNSNTAWIPFDNNLPYVPINGLEINYIANKIRAGTFGRGAWESGLNCPNAGPLNLTGTQNINYFEEVDGLMTSTQNFGSGLTNNYRSTTEVDLLPGFTATATTGSSFKAFIHGCSTPGNSFKSHSTATFVNSEAEEEEKQKIVNHNNISIYPNPNDGSFQVSITKNNKAIGVKEVKVFDIMGQVIWQAGVTQNNTFNIDIKYYAKGVYYVRSVNEDGEIEMQKLIKE